MKWSWLGVAVRRNGSRSLLSSHPGQLGALFKSFEEKREISDKSSVFDDFIHELLVVNTKIMLKISIFSGLVSEHAEHTVWSIEQISIESHRHANDWMAWNCIHSMEVKGENLNYAGGEKYDCWFIAFFMNMYKYADTHTFIIIEYTRRIHNINEM